VNTADTKKIFENYVSSKKVVSENTETDPKNDPAGDGPQVTDADKYLANKHQAIANAISSKNQEEEENRSEHEKGVHGDALFIWDYLLHKKMYSPQDALKVINLAKVAFEHQI